MTILKKQRKTLKLILLIIIGIILFGFGGMLTKPIFYNSSLKPSMAILAVFAAMLGPLAGFLIGFFGHLITDIMIGLGVSPFWVLGTGIVGIGIGLFQRIMNYDFQKGIFDQKSFLVFLTLTFVSNFVGYLFSAIFDYFMMSEELNKVITQQMFVAITNTAMIVLIGGPILKLIAFLNLRNISNANNQKAIE
jgi:energy-coupling factor transport system substrate-specific component